jgi:hypothetical protein
VKILSRGWATGSLHGNPHRHSTIVRLAVEDDPQIALFNLQERRSYR